MTPQRSRPGYARISGATVTRPPVVQIGGDARELVCAVSY
jgi:hypothetical protein